MLTGIFIGVVVAATLAFVNQRNARKGTGLPGQVEQALRTHGPATIKQVAAAVGKTSFMGRGEVVQALAALQTTGKVRIIDAPPGTPRAQKVDVVRYELIAP